MTTSTGTDGRLDLVTGAFGNAGGAIARALNDQGRSVRTLTGHPGGANHRSSGASADVARNPGSPIDVRPFHWDDPDRLADDFAAVDTFYDTYWMRQGDAHGGYELAVERCCQLIAAAEAAGVRRIIHLSVAHPSLDSPYPYFRAKARVERRLAESPVATVAVRPTLIFGGDSMLLNNLAWLLRRLPVFAVAGGGRYRVRPVHVDDLASLCVRSALEPAGAAPTDGGPDAVAGGRAMDPSTVGHRVVDAVGPDRPTYLELVTELRDAVGGRARIVKAPVTAVLAAGRVLGAVLRDELLDRDELVSTMEGLADTDGPATGDRSLLEWITANADTLGREYASERAKRS